MTMMQERLEAPAPVDTLTPSPLHGALGLPADAPMERVELIMTGMGAEERSLLVDALTSEIPGELGDAAREQADMIAANTFPGKGQTKKILGLNALNTMVEIDRLG